MIQGLGTDIVEVERVKEKILKPFGFLEKVFSEKEVALCQPNGTPRFESYAGRFAAKEAFLKAIGISWIDELDWREIEILSEDSGKPYLHLKGHAAEWLKSKGISKCHVSIAHVKMCAVATVILES